MKNVSVINYSALLVVSSGCSVAAGGRTGLSFIEETANVTLNLMLAGTTRFVREQ
jgi:hypothetical protein